MKRLYRSRSNRVVAGICGGLGELYEIDPTLIRLALIFTGLATGMLPGVVTYVVGSIVIPDGPLPSE